METMRSWLDDPALMRLGSALLGVAVVVLVAQALQRLFVRRVHDVDMRYRMRKIVTFGGYLAAAVAIYSVYSSHLTGVTVAFGVAGAGIAFALQEVIASVAGWVALSFSRFYGPGDRVQLGGIKGDVIDIGILRTTLMEMGDWVNGDLYNGRIVRVANSFVFKEPVYNYSADFPFLWDEITMPIKYGSDRALTQQILEETAKVVVGDYSRGAEVAWEQMVQRYRIENARVAPMVTLVANDNWLEYTLRYVVDYRRRRVTKDALYRGILDKVDATGDRVVIASTTLQLMPAPPQRPPPNTE